MIRNRSNLIYFSFLFNNLFWQNIFIISYLLLNTEFVNINFFFYLIKRKKLWLKFWLLSFNWKIKNLHNYRTATLLSKINYCSKLLLFFSNISLLFLSSYSNFFKLLLNSVHYFITLRGKFNFLLLYINNLIILQIFNFNAMSIEISINNFLSNKIFWISFFRKKHLSIHLFTQKFFFIYSHHFLFNYTKETHISLYNLKNIIKNEAKLVNFYNYYPNTFVFNVYSSLLNSFLLTIYTLLISSILLFV